MPDKEQEKEIEIYIHIPFCVRKCSYCDFLSFPASEELQAEYCRTLIREIRTYADRSKQDCSGIVSPGKMPAAYLRTPAAAPEEVSSIFIGGGTPTVPDEKYITEILDAVRDSFRTEKDAEITIEANPGTVSYDKLVSFRRAGINRLSFGLQSASDRELLALGRIHTVGDFEESYALAFGAGFDNINIDLMSAIPGQSIESWEKTLRFAAEHNPSHISAYSLIIEEGTPFFEKYSAIEKIITDGGTPEQIAKLEDICGIDAGERLPDEETERVMYDMTRDILSEYGYRQYEISNYAKPGRECRHNVGYWTGVPYIGFGLGASSFYEHTRYKNTEVFGKYLAGDFRRTEEEKLSRDDEMAEFMILGLRMTDGVSEEEFRKRFGKEMPEVYGGVIRKYKAAGLLEESEGRIFLSRSGISLSNTVFEDFL